MLNTFYLSVAGITMEIQHDTVLSVREFVEQNFDPLFHEYITEDCSEPDYKITYRRSHNYTPAGENIMRCNLFRVRDLSGAHHLEFTRSPYDPNPLWVCNTMTIQPGLKSAEIVEYTDCEAPRITLRYVIRTLFEGVILRHGAFILHGAAVEYNGEGIVFSAPSGTGKTTHTDFWVNELGASILNGDSPIVRADGDRPCLCGSPWCGSSRQSVNREVPLRAVVILRRGDENRIERVTDSSAIYDILPEIRRMPWIKEQAEYAVDCLEMLLKKSEIYRLYCLPNPESAHVALDGIGLK